MPKKRKNSKNTKSYYDPNLEKGYAIMRDPQGFLDLGDALTLHDRELEKLIDSEIEKYNQQNAEEIEWEKKKQEDKKSILDRMADMPIPSEMGGTNQLGLAMEGIGSAYHHIKNHDVPGMPEDYDLGDFFKDQWNSFFGEMNKLLAEDARGYQVRAENDKNLIKDYMDSLDKLDEIDYIDRELQNINSLIQQPDMTAGQIANLKGERAKMLSDRERLKREYDALAPSRSMLEDMTDLSKLGAWIDGSMSGNELFGSGDWWNLAGRTTAGHDQMNDARRFLYNLKDGNLDRNQKRQALSRAYKEYGKLNEDWNAIIEENENEAQKHNDKISKWFQGRAEKAGINFTDPDTYLFKMPGIMGGSASSYMKQVPAMLAGIVGGAVGASLVGAGALGTSAALAATATGAGTSFAFNRAAGISENNAEVALATIEKVKERTGLEEDDIKKILSGEMKDPAKLRKITENIHNVENLFLQDMAATTWDAAVDAMLMAVPIGFMSSLGKYLKGTKAVEKLMEKAGTKAALAERFGKDFVQGWETGSLASPLAGVGAGLANATIGRGVRAGASKVKNILVRKLDDTFDGALIHDLVRNTEKVAESVGKLNPTKIAAEQAAQKGLRAQYMKGITGKTIKSTIAEGIEEGKQHVNAEAFKNDLSDPKLKSTMEVAFDDMMNGLTMGAYVMGIPLDGLGIINIKDQDLLQEIKGGMLGGWGQTATVSVVQSTLPYVRQKSALSAAVELIYADKLSSTAKMKQYKYWLLKGLMKPTLNDMNVAFNMLRKTNDDYEKTNGATAIATNLIDEAQKLYNHVMSVALNPLTRKMAEDAGIEVRSWKNPTSWRSNEEYYNFVAARVVAEDRLKEVVQNLAQSKAEADKIRNSVSAELGISNEGLWEVLSYLQSEEGSEQRSGERYTVTGEGVRYNQDPFEKLADTVTAEGQHDFEYTNRIAYLAALFRYRELVERGLEALKNNPHKKVRRGLKDQLSWINKLIDIFKKQNTSLLQSFSIDVGNGLSNYVNHNKQINTLLDLEDNLVYNAEQHQRLSDAYFNQIKWQNEYDSVTQNMLALTGQIKYVDNSGNVSLAPEDWNPRDDLSHVRYEGSKAKDIMKDLFAVWDDDDAFEQAVETVYQDDLKAQHLNDQNAILNPYEIDPNREKVPVKDANGNQILVQFDEQGRINRKLADNETIDDRGMLWQYKDHRTDNPVNRINHSAPTPEQQQEADRIAFREAWNNINGQPLPLTPEGMVERRQRALFEAARARGSWDVENPPQSSKKAYTSPSSTVYTVDKFGFVAYEQPEEDPQDTVLNDIERRFYEDKQTVLNDPNGYHTTSQDYFILQDGKVVRASRVHNIKKEPYVHKDEKKVQNDLLDELKTAKSIEEIRDVLAEYIVPFDDSQVYLKYLEDNWDVLYNNPTAETAAELNRTLYNLSRVWSSREQSPSILVDNIVDEISRNFFGSDVLYNSTQTEDGIKALFNSKNESDDRTYNELYRGNYDAFASLIRSLQGMYEYYTNTLGWKLTTLPFTIRALFNDLGWVAGQPDMIGIDKNGRVHIIDFKTSKYTFGSVLTPNIKLTQDYLNDLKLLKNEDFYGPDGFERKSIKARRILRSIKNDGYKNIDIQRDGNRAVISNKTKPFHSLPNQSYGQQISAYEDYSNQLTAYAEMLKANGFDVASIEILPFKVSYDYEFTEPGKGIVRIQMEDRTPLTFSSSMKSILDGVETREDQVINKAQEDLHNNIGNLQYRIDNLAEKISDEVFNELSDQGKLLYSNFIAEARNALSKAENILYDNNSKDLDVLNAQNDAIEAVLSRFDAFLKDLREDYKQARPKAAQQAENESKRDQQKRRESQDDDQPANGVVQAPNKRDSAGNTTRSNLNYRRVNSDPELTRATMAPNFIDDADITLYAEGDDIYADIQFQGHTWQRVMIDTKYNGTWIPNSKKLHDDIERMQREHPGARIVPVKATMTRTAGRLNLLVKDGHLVYQDVRNTDLFAGQDIYDIEFSASYQRIGYVDDKGVVLTFEDGKTTPQPLYQWPDARMAAHPGTLIYLKPTPKNECPSNKKTNRVAVAIDRVKIKQNDVNFIIEAIKNPSQLDKPYFKEINGTLYNLHATPRQLINLIIPFVDSPNQLQNFDSIIRDPNNPMVVYIMKRADLLNQTTGRGRFDLSTQEGINNFTLALQNMSIAERHEVLSSRLGAFSKTEGEVLPFGGIKLFFIEQNGAITGLDITDTIKFDLEDFKIVTSSTGVRRQGVSGFGYYLKHGMLRTQYAGIGSANVEIKDAVIDAGQPAEVQSNGIQAIPNMEETPTAIDSSEIDAFLMKTVDHTSKNKPLSEEKARKHIEEILGDSVPVEFHNTFLRVLYGKAHVVGNCKTDAIVLSSLGWPGVEYHEAFHRVFEMLLSSYERDMIYHKIAKRIGVDLYDQYGNENKEAFRLVAEYAADRYMQHMNHHMTDIKIPFITKVYNKIHDWVSALWHISDRDLYKTFARVNRGEFRNAKPSQQAIDRFNRLFSELHCEIHGIPFDHIVNRPMYDKLRQSVMFCVLQGQNVDPSGRNIQEIGRHIDKETFLAGVEKLKKKGLDIFGDSTDIPTIGQLAMKEIYDNFDNDFLRDDIANDISVLSTDFVKEFEDESIEDAQSDDVTNANIGEHTRSSYEFSRFSKTSSRVRFFFATIPDTTYLRVTETLPDGKTTVKMKQVLATNEFGLPQYVPVHAVFNEFLNLFHDVDTLSELKARLEFFAKEDSMYNTLYKAFDKIYKSVYTITDGTITRNSDQEALLVQLMNVIRSNKHNFDIARSMTTNNGHGMHRIVIQTTDADYNATFYPTQWNQMLVNGGTPLIKISSDGSLQFNRAHKGVEQSFANMANLLSHGSTIKTAENGASYNDVGIKEWLINAVVGGEQNLFLRLKVNGKPAYFNNPKNPEQLEVVKDKIVEMLNMIGILFSADEFNYMLRNKYGSTDYEALAKMFTSNSRNDSMKSFLKFLMDVAPNGKLQKEVRINNKTVKLENAYAKMAFVRDLANWKYQYRHSHDQLTVLATNNNKFYEISDNNYASDVARMINKRTSELDELLADPFAYFEGEEDVTGERPVYGSLILKEITRNPDAFITLRNFVGFKTDKRGDTGSDYFQISKREDYVAKATILEQGGIIMPTLSDKKTWLYIDGIKLPGLDYSGTVDENGNVVAMAAERLGNQFVITADPMSQLDNVLSQNEAVIDQFISYAYSEYEAVKKADRDLDEMEKNGTKSNSVANYYTKEQGAKFGSLLGVWVYTYKKGKDGQPVISGEKFESFNNKKLTRKKNIERAELFFFNQPHEVLQALIARLLHKQLLKEIDTCVELGLIRKVDNSGNIFGDYENVGLNNQAIDAIYKSIVLKNGQPKDAIAMTKYKSLATLIYLNDISNKAIMSGHEFERVFSGNPAFYKWGYDDATGALIDRTVDELKRLGGIVSTGNNNFVELQDVPSKYLDEEGKFKGTYVAAEVDNELIESPQIDFIQERMLYGEVLTAAYNKEEQRRLREYRAKYDMLTQALNNGEELSQEDYDWINSANPQKDEQLIRENISLMLDSVELEDLKKLLDSTTLAIAERKAKEATDSYRLKYKDGKIDDGIDVADGGAYITDTMAEMLLRMNGNYSTDILKAFKILREEVPSNLTLKYQAYQQVVTSVIGSQKYTAFGRRKHAETGTQVTYYNKMALFPLFKCIATGRMQNVYQKMQQQGIDMLMINSAVKVGSEGSKPIDWDQYPQTESDDRTFNESFDFNTYEQKFMYLRKQLNTDPKEESMMSMGTQMTKVVMSSLFDGRTYYMQDGTEMSGKELRDDIMKAINTLSNRGLHNIVTRFFKTDNKGNLIDKDGNIISDDSAHKILDENKFAKEVRNMMQTKDPDRNIIDALEMVEQTDADGKVTKHMRLPLNAISNSNWLESVLISSINKKVVDIETPGAAFIQRSVWAMEGSTMFDRVNGSILSDEDLPASINGGNRLLMINEEGSMDCVVSFDFIKKMFKGVLPVVPIKDKKTRNVIWDLIPETDSKGNTIMKDGKPVYKQKKDKDGNLMFDKDGKPIYKRKIRTREMSFDEARSWLINRGIIGPNATANVIGYRIPTQAQSSIHALRIVDILPVVNDTVILPAEFTKITGSDFDIDKLFLSSVQYTVTREEGEDGKFHQTVSSDFKETNPAYYQNKLLKDYLAVLLDWTSHEDKKQRTVNILHRSIDNDTKLLKNIIKDLEEGKGVKMEEPYSFYSLSTQTASKDDYITGKIGIGPFALNNNNHILTMMYHVRFKHIESSIMAALNLENLDSREDKNHESIMSWISALINAHVDIAKDPYISRLNVGPFTYNLVNLLIRTGLGSKTFYFTTQPIMKELAKAYVNAGALYMADPHKGKFKLLLEAIENLADEYFKELGDDAARKIQIIKEGGIKNAKARTEINLEINKLFQGDTLRQAAKSNTVNKELQLLVYLAYLQFDKYANALSNLVKYSKIDTKKHGKSIVELMIYQKGYAKTFDISRPDNLFEATGLSAMQNDSYIATKTQNAIGSTRSILLSQFIQSTPSFQGSVDEILTAIGREESLSVNLVTKVCNALSAAVKSKFFVDTYIPAISSNPHYAHDLVSESQEYMDFVVNQNGNTVQLNGTAVHDLQSYCNGGVAWLIYKGQDGKDYQIPLNVIGADTKNNTITVDKQIPKMYGKVLLKGGKNTIYDRLTRLKVAIATDPQYAPLRSESGDINNRLLQMMVPGTTTEYKPSFIIGEHPDTYETSKFVKLFNFVEDSGNTANYIIDGWEELLQYTDPQHPEAQKIVRDFARDLIVYAFITSGDRGGFTKMFKYVPASWREESGYGQFIHDKLAEYSIGFKTDIDIDDVLLNNWYDNELCPTYQLQDKRTKQSNFMKYYTLKDNKRLGFPTILAALTIKDGKLQTTIDPATAPRFIKVPRRQDSNASDSQRRYTVYKMHKIAVGNNGIEYPVYIKVNLKGNQVSGGFIITEYGRSDNMNRPEYSINEETLRKVYQASTVADHINAVKRTEPIYASIIEGLNRAWNKEQESQGITDQKIQQNIKSNVISKNISKFNYLLIEGDPINIWAGSNENSEFSNLYNRPFKYSGINFNSVEQAFQRAKFEGLIWWLDMYSENRGATNKVINQIRQAIDDIMNAKTGAEAKQIGLRRFTTRSPKIKENIDLYFSDKAYNKNWNDKNERIMKILITASFEQNPKMLENLFATGRRPFTHTQATDKWKTEFPRILLEVRSDLYEYKQKLDSDGFSSEDIKKAKLIKTKCKE